jgi:hypothetical protein
MTLLKEIQSRARTGSVRQRAIAVFCGLIFCAASSSAVTAAQRYHCEYDLMSPSDKGLHGEWDLEVSGDVLKAIIKERPPYRLAGRLVLYNETKYKILARNKVGIVAVQPHSEQDKRFGTLVGAKVLTIRTSDGAMREGTVEVAGVYDLLKGVCK